MDNRFKNIVLIAFIYAQVGCGADEEIIKPSNNTDGTNVTAHFKIMPFGASRVEGATPEYESYRYKLWAKLVEGKHSVDFIGSNDDGAEYPSIYGIAFDGDHEGWGGWTSGELLSKLEGWLNQVGAPDIVLFSTPGGNDALQSLSYDKALENSNTIIDIFQKSNPDVTILIEKPAPAHSSIMKGDLERFLLKMKEDVEHVATSQTTNRSKVLTVDMFTGFTDQHLADDVHYNEEGAEFIASQYYKALLPVLKN